MQPRCADVGSVEQLQRRRPSRRMRWLQALAASVAASVLTSSSGGDGRRCPGGWAGNASGRTTAAAEIGLPQTAAPTATWKGGVAAMRGRWRRSCHAARKAGAWRGGSEGGEVEGWAGGAGNRSTAAPQRRQPIGCQDPLSRYVRRREIDQEAYPGYPGREDGTLDPTGRSITQATSGQNGGWPGPTRAQQELPRPVPNQMFSGRAPAACRAAGPGPNLCLRGANSTVVFLHAMW